METPLLISTSTTSKHFLVKFHLLRDLHYLENFFQTQALIASYQHKNSTANHSSTSLLHYLRIRFYQCLMTAAAAVCFSRVYTQEGHSYLLNIALYNMAFIEGFKGHWNVWLGGFALLTVFYYQLAYFRGGKASISGQWLVTVLIRPGKPAHFLWSYFEWPRFLQRRRGSEVKKKMFGRSGPKRNSCQQQFQLTLVEYFRASAVFVLNAFHLAFACNVVYYLSVQLRIASAFRRQHLFEDFFGLAAFALFEIAALITHCVIHVGLQSMVPFGVLGVTLMRMFRVRLCQIANLVEDLHRKRMRMRRKNLVNKSPPPPLQAQFLHLNSFLAANDFTVKVIPDISAIYGRALFALLLVGLPTNAILVMLLVSSRRSSQLTTTIRVLFTVIYLFEVVFIFLVHVSLSLIVIKTHAPVRRMMALFAEDSCCQHLMKEEGVNKDHSRSRADLKAKLKLTRYFEQFHSCNQFALNYGRAGKITIRSFSRQLVYYTKLVFFAYKMVSF